MILDENVCPVTLTKIQMYFKTNFSSVRQTIPPPTCVTRDCMTVLKLVLKYIEQNGMREEVFEELK